MKPTVKTCVDCQATKHLSEFDVYNRQRGYRLSYCKACRRLRRAESRAQRGVPARKQYADTDTIKWCRSCEQPISRVEFGAATYCKVCMAARTKAYRQRNPAKVSESYKRWARAQAPDYFTVREKNRRIASEYGRWLVTPKDLTSLLRRQGSECALCHSTLDSTKHLDHIIPISRGGKHRIGNLQWLCRLCNLRKNAKFVSELRLVGKGGDA